MDFTLTTEQRLLTDGVAALVRRHAGPDGHRAQPASTGPDLELLDELERQGYLDVATDTEGGPLEAVLVVETVTSGLGTCPVTAAGLVWPMVELERSAGSLAVGTADQLARGLPIRFAATPGTVLVVEGAEARVHDVLEAEPIERAWGFPCARVQLGEGRRLPGTKGDQVLGWWRIGVAAEIVASASGALQQTLAHAKERVQFNRPLASFQALQHRFAQLFVRIEGSRWLTYGAAWRGGSPAEAALAAAQAVRAGRQAVRECHQMAGAIGLTVEFGLHLWTSRISDLTAELGGPSALFAEAGALRWATLPR